jgi:hypothetical protein
MYTELLLNAVFFQISYPKVSKTAIGNEKCDFHSYHLCAETSKTEKAESEPHADSRKQSEREPSSTSSVITCHGRFPGLSPLEPLFGKST